MHVDEEKNTMRKNRVKESRDLLFSKQDEGEKAIQNVIQQKRR